MRTITLALALALTPLAAIAQDSEPTESPTEKPTSQPAAKPTALRIDLRASSQTEGTPDSPNLVQAFVYGELHKFGLRIDSKKTGHGGMDKWIKGQAKRWDKLEPEAPPASLVVTCTQIADYNGAKFYGETQAHVFKGKVTATIADAEGKTIGEFSYHFEWGKAIRMKAQDGSVDHRTKPQVKQKFDELVQKTLVAGLLSQEAIRAGIPKGKQGKLDAYIAKTRDYVLANLENKTKAVREGEMARFLRSLGEQKDD